jgi:hypothetical protein
LEASPSRVCDRLATISSSNSFRLLCARTPSWTKAVATSLKQTALQPGKVRRDGDRDQRAGHRRLHVWRCCDHRRRVDPNRADPGLSSSPRGQAAMRCARRTEGPWSERSRCAQQRCLRKPVRVATTCSMRQCRYAPDGFRPHEMFARASYLFAALLRHFMASDSGRIKVCAPARRSWNNRSALCVQRKPRSVKRLEPGHVFEVQRIR